MRNGDGPDDAHGSDEPRILVVDDDDALRQSVVRTLEKRGYGALGAASATEARALMREISFELALCDIRMPGENGLELTKALHESNPQLAIVMMSGLDDPMMARVSLDNGACGYLVKPFADNELLIAAEAALHRRRQDEQLRA